MSQSHHELRRYSMIKTAKRLILTHFISHNKGSKNNYLALTLFFDISFYKFDSLLCKDTKKSNITK